MTFRTETKNKTSMLRVVKPRVSFREENWDESETVIHDFKTRCQNNTT